MGLFTDSDQKTDANGCPIMPDELTIYDHGTSYNAIYYTTAACAAISFILSVSLIFTHLRRYRVPKEQRQIIKIIFSPCAFAIVAFGTVSNYHVAPYITDLAEWYSAIVFTCLFMLYIQFAVPDSDFGEGMFQAMQTVAQREGNGQAGGWPKLSWVLVFQYPVSQTLAIAVLEGTTAAGTYCATSFKPKFGHLWFMVLSTLGLVLCFITVLRFYRMIKVILKARRGASKLFMFKGIVGLRFIQTWIFQILVERNVMKPSKEFSLGDLVNGIPSVVLAAEMVLFSAAFWYAYSSTEYSTKARPNYEHLNFFRALLDAMNPSDIIMGIIHIPSLLLSGGAGRGMGDYAGPGKYGPLAGQGYNQQDYNLDEQDAYRTSYGYAQSPYQPPPPFYPRDEEDDGAKSSLVRGARSSRSHSQGQY